MRNAIKKNKLQIATCFFIFLLSLSVCSNAQSKDIKIIELRNYLLKPIKDLEAAGKLKDPANINRVVAQNGVTPAQPTLLPLIDITA